MRCSLLRLGPSHLSLCPYVPFVTPTLPYTVICCPETQAFMEEGPELAGPRAREEATERLSSLPRHQPVELL